MESQVIFKKLSQFGIGRRQPDDDFFKNNKFFLESEKRLGIYEIDDEALCHSVCNIACPEPGCRAEFSSMLDFDSHLSAAHSYPCSVCKKFLPSEHLLNLHCAETHDSFFAVLAERGPAFTCYVIKCPKKFTNPEERIKHCIEEHKFPHDFRFDIKPKKKKNNGNRYRNQKKRTPNTSNENSSDMVTEDTAEKPRTVPNRRKKIVSDFSFGHSKPSGFVKVSSGVNKTTDVDPTILETEEMLVDLKF